MKPTDVLNKGLRRIAKAMQKTSQFGERTAHEGRHQAQAEASFDEIYDEVERLDLMTDPEPAPGGEPDEILLEIMGEKIVGRAEEIIDFLRSIETGQSEDYVAEAMSRTTMYVPSYDFQEPREPVRLARDLVRERHSRFTTRSRDKMSNTRTRKTRVARKQNPGQVKDAVLRGQVVEAPNNWTILITENDMVELWPPGDHDGLMTHLGNLDQVVADFCKKADMPIPGVNETQGDQVKLPGDAATILGPDSSTKEFPKMKPEINERPGGLDQKGTTAPDTSLGPDSTSRNPKNFDPAINKRPRPSIERGGLPDTNLGEDSSGAATNWRDKRVRIQEDGRTRSGRRPRRRAQTPMDMYEAQEAQLPGSGAGQQVSGMGDRLKQALDNYQTDIYVEASADGTVHVFDANFDMSVDPFIALSELQRLPIGSDAMAVWDALGDSQTGMGIAADRRGLHKVQKPKRGPGQLGVGKAQMGEEAPAAAPGVVARRNISMSSKQAQPKMKKWDEGSIYEDLVRLGPRQVYDKGSYLHKEYLPFKREEVQEILDRVIADKDWGDLFQEFYEEYEGYDEHEVYGEPEKYEESEEYSAVARRRRAEEDLFNVTPNEESAKILNKGEEPSDPEEVISQSKGEKDELREEKEGFIRDSFEDRTPDPTAIYQDLRRARPSENLLRDIMDPQKWAANNIFMPSNQSGRNKHRAQMFAEDEFQDRGEMDPSALYDYIEDLKRAASETRNDAMFDTLRNAEQAFEFGDYGEAYAQAEEAEQILDTEAWRVAHRPHSARVFRLAQWALGDDSSAVAIDYLVAQGYDELAASEMVNAYMQGDVLDFQATYLIEEALGEVSKAARRADAPKGEGWERLTKDLKDAPGVDNAFALANWMKGEGYKPKEQGGGDKEKKKSRRHAREFVHEVTEEDVGKGQYEDGGIFAPLGRVQDIDVGKRIYDVGGVYQVENQEQLERRLRGHHTAGSKKKSRRTAEGEAARADELVEQWLNGNRRYVLEEVSGDVLLGSNVLEQLDDYNRGVFIRLMELMSIGGSRKSRRQASSITLEPGDYGTYLIINDATGEDILIQAEDDYEGVAETFGWPGPEHGDARQWLDDHLGETAEDPGYFSRDARRQAGPKLKENWGNDGAYGREIGAESAEELHALTMALGGDEVDWSKFKPAQPDGAPVDEQGVVDEQAAPAAQVEARRPRRPFAGRSKQAEKYTSGMENLEDVTEIDYGRSGSGKFDDIVGEFVYRCMLDGMGEPVGDEYFGSYDFLNFGEPITVHQEEGDWSFSSAIMHEDDQGFVSVDYYETGEEAQEDWAKLAKEYDKFSAEHGDDGEDEERGPMEGSKETAGCGAPERKDKEAVDPVAEQYWEGYQGEYGKQLTRGDTGDPKPGGLDKDKKEDKKKDKKKDEKKPDLKSDGYKARKAAYLNARKHAQAVAPQAQPVAPATPVPGTAPAPGGAPAPGAPAPTPAAPAKPKGMPPGTGDSGLQTLGWTPEEIALMDEQDKKKILEIQLNKPGTKKKPETPGEKPGVPKAPAEPEAPAVPGAPAQAPAPGAPAPAKPVTPAARARLAKLILRKINRRRVLAQVAQPEQPAPAPAAPAPAATPGAPAPGGAPAGEVLPEFADVGEGTSEDGKALQLLTNIQEMEVSATSPAQVPALKASYLAQKLLTELGMTVQDAKVLYGVGPQKGLTSLFE